MKNPCAEYWETHWEVKRVEEQKKLDKLKSEMEIPCAHTQQRRTVTASTKSLTFGNLLTLTIVIACLAFLYQATGAYWQRLQSEKCHTHELQLQFRDRLVTMELKILEAGIKAACAPGSRDCSVLFEAAFEDGFVKSYNSGDWK
jgi:hypothetical protein